MAQWPPPQYATVPGVNRPPPRGNPELAGAINVAKKVTALERFRRFGSQLRKIHLKLSAFTFRQVAVLCFCPITF